MGIKVGICGAGQFTQCFVPLFQVHPDVSDVSVMDIVPERSAATAKRFGLRNIFDTYEAMLESDIDAVAIFTPRWTHTPLALQALRAGKHVYCAVPAATTIEELVVLVETVKQTGLTYMLGETSYYYPATVYCRENFAEGAFGRFVYGEGEYLHDMAHGFYEAFQYSDGKDWKRTAGYPPMLYPTHSVAMVLAVTGARVTQVSCLGQIDEHEDGIFRVGANNWDNPFSNETALMRTSDGGMLRVNEFRRCAIGKGRCVRLSFCGTKGAFEEQFNSAGFVTHSGETIDLTADLKSRSTSVANWEKARDASGAVIHAALQQDFVSGFAKVQDQTRKRLPKEFEGYPNGHEGSHQLLTDDFVRAIVTGKPAPNHVWQAARYNAPGIIAHQSAGREGEMMKVPDFGWLSQ